MVALLAVANADTTSHATVKHGHSEGYSHAIAHTPVHHAPAYKPAPIYHPAPVYTSHKPVKTKSVARRSKPKKRKVDVSHSSYETDHSAASIEINVTIVVNSDGEEQGEFDKNTMVDQTQAEADPNMKLNPETGEYETAKPAEDGELADKEIDPEANPDGEAAPEDGEAAPEDGEAAPEDGEAEPQEGEEAPAEEEPAEEEPAEEEPAEEEEAAEEEPAEEEEEPAEEEEEPVEEEEEEEPAEEEEEPAEEEY